jgi:hypothetical protein
VRGKGFRQKIFFNFYELVSLASQLERGTNVPINILNVFGKTGEGVGRDRLQGQAINIPYLRGTFSRYVW